MADDHGHGGGHDAGHGDAHGSGHGGHAKKGKAGNVGNREPLIFALILGGALLIPVSLLFVFKLPPALAIAGVGLLAIGALLAPRIVQVNEYERGVIFSQGKYKKTVGPGWHWIFPTFQRIETVDMRTQTLDVPPQQVLTKEDIELTIDAIIYYRISDPKKSILEIKDFRSSLEHIIEAELRSQIGRLPLQDVLEKTEQINALLHQQVQQVESDWGIKTLNVELTDITIPKELEEAFRRKQEALEYKDKLETESQARRDAIQTIKNATEAMSDTTLAYLYMETLKKVADGRASKILFPIELTHMASAFSHQVKAAASAGKTIDEARLAEQLVTAYLASQKQAPTPIVLTRTQTTTHTGQPAKPTPKNGTPQSPTAS